MFKDNEVKEEEFSHRLLGSEVFLLLIKRCIISNVGLQEPSDENKITRVVTLRLQWYDCSDM